MSAYPKVFVVSLESRPDRRDAVRKSLSKAGVPFEFFAAVDGRTIPAPPEYDRARRLRLAGKDLQPGEIGCYLSHLGVMRRIVDEGLPYAVVLEDDLVYEKEFAQVIGALPALAGMVDLVKLGQPEVRDWKFRTVRALTGVSSLVRFKRTVNGTQGYFVTAAGAAKFLRYSRRIAYPVDVAINRVWENGLNIYGVQPWPVIHDEASPTSIEGARFERAAQPYVGVKLERRLRKAWDSLAKRLYFVTTRRRDEQVAAGGPGPETAQELARAA